MLFDPFEELFDLPATFVQHGNRQCRQVEVVAQEDQGFAVVTRDVPPYAVVVGNPARVKRMRFADAVIDWLEQLQWWQFAVWDLEGIPFDRIEAAIVEIIARIARGSMQPYQPGYLAVGGFK